MCPKGTQPLSGAGFDLGHQGPKDVPHVPQPPCPPVAVAVLARGYYFPMTQPSLAQKKCGNCTACCGPAGIFVPGTFDEWTRCSHAKGKRCGIYNDRPSECRAFQCIWSLIKSWPPELRPDRCGFLVALKDLPGEKVGYAMTSTVIETEAGANVRRLAEALALMVKIAQQGKTTRFRVRFSGQDQEPGAGIDAPLAGLVEEFSAREEVAAWILHEWGMGGTAK
jgi:hypothetical protein